MVLHYKVVMTILFSVIREQITQERLAAQEHLLADHKDTSWAWVASNVSTTYVVAGDKALRRKEKGCLSTSQLSSHPNIPLGNSTFVFFSFCLLHTMSLMPHLG